jgi:hypothetical protein
LPNTIMIKNPTNYRLESYEAFEPDIIKRVSMAADEQNTLAFSELVNSYGVGDGPQLVEPYADAKYPIEVLSLKPIKDIDYDQSTARVMFAPFGNAVTPSIAVRALRLFAADDAEQLLVVGNPALPVRRAERWPVSGGGKVDRAGRKQLVQNNLVPHVEPILRYLNSEGIENVSLFTGYSFGADLAAEATLQSNNYDIDTKSSVLLEPGGTTRRSVFSLLRAFSESSKHLERYINTTDSSPYRSAVHLTSGNLALYAAGLARPTNIASARALAMGRFAETVNQITEVSPHTGLTVGWCEQSEVVDGQELNEQLSPNVGRIALKRAHHAVGDDIDVHAALVLQGHNNNIQSTLIAKILARRYAIDSDRPA